MLESVKEGEILWTPSDERKQDANITHFMKWLDHHKKIHIETYDDLWAWSTADIETFWVSLWEYFDIQSSQPYEEVLVDAQMPNVKWFTGAKLNYTQQIFRNRHATRPAILSKSEHGTLKTTTWGELYEQTAAMAESLKKLGVQQGDRVAAYIPNIPEAVIGFLACASIGAIWSSCSPDFGSLSVVNRFKQIEPKVFIAVNGYQYNGKVYDRIDVINNVQKEIPTLEHTILVPYIKMKESNQVNNSLNWHNLIEENRGVSLSYSQVSFDHPLWILYSSGTTGIPKAIVQGHGGILLEHLKVLVLNTDVKPSDRLFWFTTTGWMMWNFLVGGLLNGTTILLYDGSPSFPNLNTLWEFAEETKMTLFGTSASFINGCMKAGIEPRQSYNLSELKAIGSTGSPLSINGFKWVYDHVKTDLWLVSASGGTDLCTAFIGGSPLLPVRAGELQCRSLGAPIEAYNDSGEPLIDDIGELVITKPMPSMPLFFWNDEADKRYKESYFNMYPGVWRHGDYIKITSQGSCIIYGRSDSTINRGGIRIGTSEIYSAVETIPAIQECLVVDVPIGDGKSIVPLFVVLNSNEVLTEELIEEIQQRIREACSPRHVPDDIYQVKDIPKTLNGKKLEVPIKKILMGIPIEKAINIGSVSNPKTIEFYQKLFNKKFKK